MILQLQKTQTGRNKVGQSAAWDPTGGTFATKGEGCGCLALRQCHVVRTSALPPPCHHGAPLHYTSFVIASPVILFTAPITQSHSCQDQLVPLQHVGSRAQCSPLLGKLQLQLGNQSAHSVALLFYPCPAGVRGGKGGGLGRQVPSPNFRSDAFAD
ncbi:hypothetical protein Bbelb_177850 [Branchiostoma belcheri]|nr:hypothetical protein Bbelb_177850 [Branchiostoma belcheri]